jgi:hypothetical protein
LGLANGPGSASGINLQDRQPFNCARIEPINPEIDQVET